MSLADLFNIPQDDDSMKKWSALHMAHHRSINFAIQQQTNTLLPLYVIDPVNLANPGAFLNQHQDLHNNTDAILGIPGYDLTEVNWNDPGQRASWIWLNATLHRAEADALGIG